MSPLPVMAVRSSSNVHIPQNTYLSGVLFLIIFHQLCPLEILPCLVRITTVAWNLELCFIDCQGGKV